MRKNPQKKDNFGELVVGMLIISVFIVFYLASKFLFTASDKDFDRLMAQADDKELEMLEKKYKMDLSRFKKNKKKKRRRRKRVENEEEY